MLKINNVEVDEQELINKGRADGIREAIELVKKIKLKKVPFDLVYELERLLNKPDPSQVEKAI